MKQEKKGVFISVRLPEVTVEQLTEAAKRAGMSRSAWIRHALAQATAEFEKVAALTPRLHRATPVEDPSSPPDLAECPHPKEAKRILGYVTLCSACGKRL